MKLTRRLTGNSHRHKNSAAPPNGGCIVEKSLGESHSSCILSNNSEQMQ